jgi:hypothetical protein
VYSHQGLIKNLLPIYEGPDLLEKIVLLSIYFSPLRSMTVYTFDLR